MVKIQKTAKPKVKARLVKLKQKQMQNVIVNINKQTRKKKVDTIQAPPKQAEKPSISFSPQLSFAQPDSSLLKEILKQNNRSLEETLKQTVLNSTRQDEIEALKTQLGQLTARFAATTTEPEFRTTQYQGSVLDDRKFANRSRLPTSVEHPHSRLGGEKEVYKPGITDITVERELSALRTAPVDPSEEQKFKFAAATETSGLGASRESAPYDPVSILQPENIPIRLLDNLSNQRSIDAELVSAELLHRRELVGDAITQREISSILGQSEVLGPKNLVSSFNQAAVGAVSKSKQSKPKAAAAAADPEALPKRGVGRPKKEKQPIAVENEVPKRGPGRPRKVDQSLAF